MYRMYYIKDWISTRQTDVPLPHLCINSYSEVNYFLQCPYLTCQGGSFSGPWNNWFGNPPYSALKESITTLRKASISEDLFEDRRCDIAWSSTKPTIEEKYLVRSFIICVLVSSSIHRWTLRWAGHVAYMSDEKGAYRPLITKSEKWHHFGNVGIQVRVILKWIYKKEVKSRYATFTSFGIGTSPAGTIQCIIPWLTDELSAWQEGFLFHKDSWLPVIIMGTQTQRLNCSCT
jgi:hypothetical protein